MSQAAPLFGEKIRSSPSLPRPLVLFFGGCDLSHESAANFPLLFSSPLLSIQLSFFSTVSSINSSSTAAAAIHVGPIRNFSSIDLSLENSLYHFQTEVRLKLVYCDLRILTIFESDIRVSLQPENSVSESGS